MYKAYSKSLQIQKIIGSFNNILGWGRIQIWSDTGYSSDFQDGNPESTITFFSYYKMVLYYIKRK